MIPARRRFRLAYLILAYACVLLVFSWTVLWAGGMPAAGLAVLTVFFAGIAAFLLSRPALLLASVFWGPAFMLFLVWYIPVLTSPRVDGRPG